MARELLRSIERRPGVEEQGGDAHLWRRAVTAFPVPAPGAASCATRRAIRGVWWAAGLLSNRNPEVRPARCVRAPWARLGT